MNRSCQRHTQVFDLPVSAMITLVPAPSPLSSTIRACRTCFCWLFGSAMMAFSRLRSLDDSVNMIPVRMPDQTRIEPASGESPTSTLLIGTIH